MSPVLSLLFATAAMPDAVRPTLDLPVREVTVFSDRARVTRRGTIPPGSGNRSISLPFLPVSVDPTSVRLEARGARVVRVEVRRATEDTFPRTEALELLRKLESLRDEQRAVEDAIRVRDAERQAVLAIRPAAVPQPDPRAPALKLDASGWAAALAFLDARAAADDAALAPLEEKRRAKEREIEEVSARANQVLAGTAGTPGWRPDAVVEIGSTAAELALTYVAAGARWYPSYDVRYSHGEGQVDVEFSGLVSQETGEDWTDAALTLSTAIPATVAALPKLPVWKLGQKERFIPTPQAQYEPPATRPAGVVAPAHVAVRDDDVLRRALQEAVSDSDDEERTKSEAPPPPADRRRKAEAAPRRAPSRPPPPPAGAPMEMPMAPAPMVREMADYEPESRVSATLSGLAQGFFGSGYTPTESVSFGAPRGWAPPSYARDLPAALAGGYDFAYPAARPETVRGGGEVRRVALHSRRFPAQGMVRILPALSRQAFLVAEVANDGDRPLLQGAAHLFVGADLVGEAVVPNTAVGEKVTLPLGVDDAVRVERNVQVVEGEQGLISKDDVSRYEVVVEVLNPRTRTLKTVLIDQIPLRRAEDARGRPEVKIALTGADPPAQPEKDDGFLAWRFDLAAGAKKTVKFAYTVTRPKDARLQQYGEPAGRIP